MRASDRRRARRAWALVAAVAVLFALVLTVSSDARLDHPTGATAAAQALVADEVPPGVVPEAMALTIVWLAIAVVGLAAVATPHRRVQAQRGRAPPEVSVSI